MSLASLIATGTKVWLDGVVPENIRASRALGVTGATSNPTIVSQIVGTGRFDDRIVDLARQGHDDEAIAWALDDELVKSAQQPFLPAWQQTKGDDGYVSFELDPLIEFFVNTVPVRVDLSGATTFGELVQRCRCCHCPCPWLGRNLLPCTGAQNLRNYRHQKYGVTG